MVWPHVRTALILLHVLAVVVLSLPKPGRLLRKDRWDSEMGQRDMAAWAKRLSWLGYQTKEQFQDDLWALAVGYGNVNRMATRSFQPYERYAGVRQGWAMFSNPQENPVEIHVDVLEGSRWEPIYRPLSDEHDFWAPQFRHHRTRKVVGRWSRGFHADAYDGLARIVATDAAAAFPESRAVRVQLYKYWTLSPEDVREGLKPEGKYEHVRLFRAEDLR